MAIKQANKREPQLEMSFNISSATDNNNKSKPYCDQLLSTWNRSKCCRLEGKSRLEQVSHIPPQNEEKRVRITPRQAKHKY